MEKYFEKTKIYDSGTCWDNHEFVQSDVKTIRKLIDMGQKINLRIETCYLPSENNHWYGVANEEHKADGLRINVFIKDFDHELETFN